MPWPDNVADSNYTPMVTNWFVPSYPTNVIYQYYCYYNQNYCYYAPPFYGEGVKTAEEATKKAECLLLMVLNDKQKQQYKELGYFETEVGDRVYRIKKGYSGNVELIDNGKPKTRFCIHTDEWLPDADTMLAQLLMLRTNEKKFLEVANHTQILS